LSTLAGLAALFIAVIPAGAAPGDTVIARPGGGPALIVPAASPVRFTGFDENGVARFSGRFLLTGSFVYDCPADCDPGMTRDDVELQLIPDPELAARLPHWQDRGDRMVVEISTFKNIEPIIAGGHTLDDLLTGKISDVRGRLEIRVYDFAADFGCDYSPYYSAQFEALAKPIQVADVPIDGNVRCP
jgi:hypothetical protein